jgi:hypothetical protein
MSAQAMEKEYQSVSDETKVLNQTAPLNPSHIMQTATAFWASKVLLTAVQEFDLFTVLADDAMTGFQAANFMQLGEKFDFSRYHSVSDIGGALALLSRIVASQHQHLSFNNFDLPPVAPLAQKQIDAAGMTDRIQVVSGDFFVDELPKADVITMGNILHDWNLEKKKLLIKKAYDALPEGGAFVVIENLIDDARRENMFGLLMSLNMLIEFGDAFDYTGSNFRDWCSEVGFKRFEIIPLAGPTSAAVAYK